MSLAGLLAAYASTYEQSVKQATTEAAEAFMKARQRLWAALDDSIVNSRPPTVVRLIEQIGAARFFGNGLKETLTKIVDASPATPGETTRQIQSHVKDARTYFETVSEAKKVFEALKVPTMYLDKDEYEVGASLPLPVIDGLSKELKLLNIHLKTFGEIVQKDSASPKIRDLSKGSLEIFVEALPEVAAAVSRALVGLTGTYLMILQIRKLRRELGESGVPPAALEPVKDHEEKQLKDGPSGDRGWCPQGSPQAIQAGARQENSKPRS